MPISSLTAEDAKNIPTTSLGLECVERILCHYLAGLIPPDQATGNFPVHPFNGQAVPWRGVPLRQIAPTTMVSIAAAPTAQTEAASKLGAVRPYRLTQARPKSTSDAGAEPSRRSGSSWSGHQSCAVLIATPFGKGGARSPASRPPKARGQGCCFPSRRIEARASRGISEHSRDQP